MSRNGVFIGAYVPEGLKTALQLQAKSEHRTLSQQITRILEIHINGNSNRRRREDKVLPDDLRELVSEDERGASKTAPTV